MEEGKETQAHDVSRSTREYSSLEEGWDWGKERG